MALAEEELSRLELNLQQSQQKFFEWTGESFRNRITEKGYQHNSEMKSEEDKLDELEKQIHNYHEEANRKCKVLEEQRCEVVNLEQKLKELQLSAQQLTMKRDNEKQHLLALENQIVKDTQEIDAKEQSTKRKLEHFVKGTELFRENLGLEFKKIDVDNLQFVFKFIDPNDWEKPFIFTVCIDSNNRRYTVKDCMPEVNDLDLLVEELNTTDNFSRFVCQMRNKFKETAR